MEIAPVRSRVEAMSFHLTITDAAKEFIASKGYDVQYGARPLRRAVQTYMEDEVAEVMMMNKLQPNDVIVLDYNSEESKIISKVESVECENAILS